MEKTVFVLGSGGREHALCHKLSLSPHVVKIYCATGNAGIASIAQNVQINIQDPVAILDFCQAHHVDLVVIGSEAPAAAGVADLLRMHQISVFGPSQAASMLESSKGFTKDICAKVNAPTARYVRCDNSQDAIKALSGFQAPYVIKADGLAAGKGVIIAETHEEAENAVHYIFSGGFDKAGSQVVIEQFLTGEEASFFVITDGITVIPFGSAQDHKRAFDGDQGPNTGGMGAYSPAPVLTDVLQSEAIEKIIKPVLSEMAHRGTPFTGVLYAGLMITDNAVQLIEFNVRFGDPEAQVLMQRLTSDLYTLFQAVADQKLASLPPLQWHDDYAVTIVMASKNYPDDPIKGEVIALPSYLLEHDMIYHAGTAVSPTQQLITNGGRVLNITSSGKTLEQAVDRAYDLVKKVSWAHAFYRSDIGAKELARKK